MTSAARLAMQALVNVSADIEVQLEKGTGTRPVLWLLQMARDRAAEAMQGLMTVDPSETEQIRALQNSVVMFDAYVEDCRLLLARGKEADGELREIDREEMQDLVTDEEAEAYHINQNKDA